jgi:hypothetical protein
MPGCTSDLPAIATPTLDYAWATAAQVDCNTDQGGIKTMGGLILEVPANASGTYVIGLDNDPNNSFMTSGSGVPIPGVQFTAACITVITGKCCSNIGPNVVCTDGVTEGDCGNTVPPNAFTADDACQGTEDDCPSCEVDSDCEESPADLCTDNICNADGT